MLTPRRLVACIQPNDWFVKIDLKSAYFHIPIHVKHRKYLRFAFRGKAYEFKVLPFGLALSPLVFTKCLEAALAPLRHQGVRIYQYLDDGLICSQSEETLLQHLELVLTHLKHLGFIVNVKKSVLTPAQSVLFLGMELNSRDMRVRLSSERMKKLQLTVRQFVLGRRVTSLFCQKLLGMMAAAAVALPMGILRMRHFQLWYASQKFHPCRDRYRRVLVTHECMRALSVWKRGVFLHRGAPLGSVTRRITVTTDASSTGWGALCQGWAVNGRWSASQAKLHINVLELLTVLLALRHFLVLLRDQHVLVRSDNTSAIAYINRQGGVRSRPLCYIANRLLSWAEKNNLLSLRAVHVPGHANVGADLLSRGNPRAADWRLHPQVVEKIWALFGRAKVDLFATRLNAHCPLWFSLGGDSPPLGVDALAHPWPTGQLYAFPPIALLPQVLARVREDHAALILVAPLWSNQSWFPDLCSLAVGAPWVIPTRRDLLTQGRGAIMHPRPALWKLAAWQLKG